MFRSNDDETQSIASGGFCLQVESALSGYITKGTIMSTQIKFFFSNKNVYKSQTKSGRPAKSFWAE